MEVPFVLHDAAIGPIVRRAAGVEVDRLAGRPGLGAAVATAVGMFSNTRSVAVSMPFAS